jgi:hypothetical protein
LVDAKIYSTLRAQYPFPEEVASGCFCEIVDGLRFEHRELNVQGGFMTDVKSVRILMVVAASTALACSTYATAQTTRAAQAEQMRSAIVNHPNTIKQLGLDDQSIGLSSEQRSEIDRIVDIYLAEQDALRAKHPVTPGTPATAEMREALQASQAKLNLSIGKLLNADQRQAWASKRQAQMAQRFTPGGR